MAGDPSGEAPYLQNRFKGLGTGVMTQYCQGVATGAVNCPAGNGQHVAYPSGGTDNWETGGFCAWQDYNGAPMLSRGPAVSPYGDVSFSNLPYLTDAGACCGEDFVNPGTAGTLDGVSSVVGHEYAETITDQNPAGGLTDPSGEEDVDKCAWAPRSPPAGRLT